MKQTTGWLGTAITAAALLCAGLAAAAMHTWTGAVSAEWTNDTNWSGGLTVAGRHGAAGAVGGVPAARRRRA